MKDPHDLITRYLSGLITPEEVVELENKLGNNQQLQDFFLEEVELDCLLRQETHQTAAQLSPTNLESRRRNKISSTLRSGNWKWPVGLAGCALLLFSLNSLVWQTVRPIDASTPSLGEVQNTSLNSGSDLCKAAALGDLNGVQREIESGADVNFTNGTGHSPLHLATLYGHSDVATYLIEHEASLKQTDRLGNTALHIAAFLGRWLLVEELLEAGSDPQTRNLDGFNPDDLVALNWNPNLERYYGYLEQIFSFRLDYGKIKQNRPRIRATISRYMKKQPSASPIDPTDLFVSTTARLLGKSLADSSPSLMSNSLSDSDASSVSVTENLLRATIRGVLPRTTAIDAPTVSLTQAAKTGNIAAVNQHISAGSDLNVRNELDGCTPIILAAAFGRMDVVQQLIAAGADLSATNNQGHTVLHAAAFFARKDIVSLLIESENIDVQQKNLQGETAEVMVSTPLNAELRSVYRYIYALMKMELDLEQIKSNREIIAKMLADFAQ